MVLWPGALEFGGAPASALAPLLQIGQSLTPDNFRLKVVPALSKLFASNDRSVRRSLLESIDTYGPHLTEASTHQHAASLAIRLRRRDALKCYLPHSCCARLLSAYS